MKKFLTIVTLALLLVAFGAAQWGQAGHTKAHQLRQRVTVLEQKVADLRVQVNGLTIGHAGSPVEEPCEGTECPGTP